MKNLNNTAFSLLEILLAAIIFIVSVGGVFVTLNAVRTPVTGKESALAAAVFGKQVLEALRSSVSQEPVAYYTGCSTGSVGTLAHPCPDFALSVGVHEVSTATLSVYGLMWPSAALSTANQIAGVTLLSYTVTCADGSAAPSCGGNADVAHQVALNISY